MQPNDRLAEICDILAAGLMRLNARKSSLLSTEKGESFLDFAGYQSGHPNVLGLEGAQLD
jgi:hypothetical protein